MLSQVIDIYRHSLQRVKTYSCHQSGKKINTWYSKKIFFMYVRCQSLWDNSKQIIDQ